MNLEITHIELDSVNSTNAYAQKYLSENSNDGIILITTKDQKEGKGQFENKWESESGKNLTCSIVFKPKHIVAHQQFYISQAISLGIKKTLDTIVDNVSIKWPNDIYVGNKKICGILIENQLMGSTINHSIIGIGLNVNQIAFKSNAPNPTSLSLETKKTFNLSEIRDSLVANILSYFFEIDEYQNFEDIAHDYQNSMFLKDSKALFVRNNETFYATIKGVTEIGKLILEIDSSHQEFSLNEVKLAIPIKTLP